MVCLWSRPCGERGGIKELQKTVYAPFRRLTRPRTKRNVRALASGYGSEGVCLGSTKAHSATPSNSPGNPHEESAKAEATHKKVKQAGEASWLKQNKSGR
jgi:hypothetical protein